jgi:hypothetical protein
MLNFVKARVSVRLIGAVGFIQIFIFYPCTLQTITVIRTHIFWSQANGTTR